MIDNRNRMDGRLIGFDINTIVGFHNGADITGDGRSDIVI